MKGWRSCLLLWAAAGCCGVLAGCAGPDLVRPLTGSAVAASLQAVNEPENRRRIEELLTSEPVVRSLRELTRAAVDAALSDLESDARQARTKKLAADFVRDLGPALGTMLDKDVLPRVENELAASVQRVLEQTLSEANQRRAGSFVTGVARQAMDGVGPQLAKSISDGVSSGIERSVRSILTRDLSPALGKALDANGPAISRVSQAATAGALQAITEAMNGPFGEMVRRERKAVIQDAADAAAVERKAVLQKLDEQIDETRRWLRGLAVAVAVGGVLLAGLGFLLWRQMRENRRLRTGG
ncbi:MAG TPA: hypothetical protein VIA62_16085 [Thermoanaerobaculia bacterium]|jgi:hypothetical protein|nr:hypothetical protein [Thermoanaerobaculia bacterium]